MAGKTRHDGRKPVKRARRRSSILSEPIETRSYFRRQLSTNTEIPPVYSLNFLSFSYPLIFHLFHPRLKMTPGIFSRHTGMNGAIPVEIVYTGTKRCGVV
jgi:hypothetical protein